mmetsp:Transcript_48498/g.71903  ORF Transcript_48498/g.71903 Transcript_48498/m.71903 type:complete len:303 (+) Transcript_48498:97-1005(+)|eukprot:CAMPEP_0195523442 /NCGR_PEP_ID=MMETSP0794_2-20130614/22639_1 /TAXON_ID=515487 /ORGANISM="Stephanopyxis turris, Strain CCMP 815" /LENGTH=302 /DNA_ID=CAMNT_0040653447 /DNA_START=40 /DNA_END=948 /DNA_ORIENTATION=+
MSFKGAAGFAKDYRTFHVGGKVDYGKIGDSCTSDLVLYLAGNQFMVMEELIGNFQKKYPSVKTVYCETLPPGEILKNHILKEGIVDGQHTSQNPDLYGSVNFAHLQTLQANGMMDRYLVYTHNKLELMVAEGNPMGICGPEDLGRDDIVQSQPNPITESIFQGPASAMLRDLNLYDKVTGGVMDKACWAVEGKVWFTERHHRETPYRIENGLADVGVVWATEIIEAKHEGKRIDGVVIPAPLDKAHEVFYALGALKTARNVVNAEKYLAYLATDEAQEIYARYGFVKATAKDLELRPIPSKQ